jgi:hypothetical protein
MVAKLSQSLKNDVLQLLHEPREIRLLLTLAACSTHFYRVDGSGRFRMPALQMLEKIQPATYEHLLQAFEGLRESCFLDKDASSSDGGMLHWQFSDSAGAELDTIRSDDVMVNLDHFASREIEDEVQPGLNSVFEIKLYLMLRAFSAVKHMSSLRLIVSLEQLQKDFNVSSFGRYDNFKSRILLPAIEKLRAPGAFSALKIDEIHSKGRGRPVHSIKITYLDTEPHRRPGRPADN